MTEQKKMLLPWFTMMLVLICLAYYVVFEYYKLYNANETHLFTRIGAPYAFQIYQGQYWGLFTNSLIHINIPHFLINGIGLWFLASYIERRSNFFKLFLLGLFASTVTSLIQLTMTSDAGVGLSGVNYFLLFFIIGKSLRDDDYKFKGRFIFLFVALLMLPFAYYLNTYKEYKIGIEAMSAGLIFGFIIGVTSNFKSKFVMILLTLLISLGSIATLFYSPWSSEWNFAKAYQFHLKNDLRNANKFYRTALKIAPQHPASRENLKIIRIEQLSDLALKAYENEEYIKAREYYERILKIDPYNSWAKENISRLP